MSQPETCPQCGSHNVAVERRINGYHICGLCGAKPREWFIDVNEWLDERERCQSGMAFTQGWLDEMEMSSHKMIPVIERSAYDALKAENERLKKALLGDCEAEHLKVEQERDRALEMLKKVAGALESSNKTIMYLMEEYANGNGVRLGHATVSFNKQVSAEYRKEFGPQSNVLTESKLD